MKDQLMVKIYDTTQQMGEAAACEVSECIKSLLSQKEEINMIFAAAPSQSAFLASLVEDKSIEWKRVNAFHMDEYIGASRRVSVIFFIVAYSPKYPLKQLISLTEQHQI